MLPVQPVTSLLEEVTGVRIKSQLLVPAPVVVGFMVLLIMPPVAIERVEQYCEALVEQPAELDVVVTRSKI